MTGEVYCKGCSILLGRYWRFGDGIPKTDDIAKGPDVKLSEEVLKKWYRTGLCWKCYKEVQK